MLSGLTDTIEDFVLSMGVWAPILACLLILIESILPILPLCAFITVNFINFGQFGGFIISWIFTCCGCFLSYSLVRYKIHPFKKHYSDHNLINKWQVKVKNISLPTLTTILAIPFTPAFLVNIAAGLADIPFKKFFKAILISKIFMVYFWGYVGVGLIESLKSPLILVRVILVVLIAYVISLIVNNSVSGNK